jgi:hypothetical protein
MSMDKIDGHRIALQIVRAVLIGIDPEAMLPADADAVDAELIKLAAEFAVDLYGDHAADELAVRIAIAEQCARAVSAAGIDPVTVRSGRSGERG